MPTSCRLDRILEQKAHDWKMHDERRAVLHRVVSYVETAVNKILGAAIPCPENTDGWQEYGVQDSASGRDARMAVNLAKRRVRIQAHVMPLDLWTPLSDTAPARMEERVAAQEKELNAFSLTSLKAMERTLSFLLSDD